ncbi:hypothetical protein DPV73_01400 [Leptospira mayottensis]|nr:hypothetical protein DPV73_01400 [Leptospira mayottensis]
MCREIDSNIVHFCAEISIFHQPSCLFSLNPKDLRGWEIQTITAKEGSFSVKAELGRAATKENRYRF